MRIRANRSLFSSFLFAYTLCSACMLFAEDRLHQTTNKTITETDGHNHGDHETHDSHDEHGATSGVVWSENLIRKSSIELKTASSGNVSVGLELPGKIVSYEANVAHITPRFPGIIREAKKHLGEEVKKGDVLAVIESNQSLNAYKVTSPIAGVVVKRHATIGEYASTTTDIFVVADLSKVWGEFYVFSEDFGKVKRGSPISVAASPLQHPIDSTVSFVSKIVDEHTQSKFIRTVLENSEEKLYPGTFANAEVELETRPAQIVVERSALQRLEGRDVVFIWENNSFEPRQVTIGQKDKKVVSILSGVANGETYAAGNTFLIKAEIGKTDAEHSH